MFIKTATKILEKNNVSYINNTIYPSRNIVQKKKVSKAIQTLHRHNVSYRDSSYKTFFNGAKSPAILKHQSIKGLDFLAIQQKSYEIFIDSVFAQSMIKSLKYFTVNSGLRLQSTPSSTILNKTSIDDITQFSLTAQDLWMNWSSTNEADYHKKYSYNSLEGMRAEHLFIFGEYFYIRRVEKDNPLTIQLIDPRNIINPTLDKVLSVRKKGGDIINGIEIDKNGKDVAIYIRTKNKNYLHHLTTRVPFVEKNGFQRVCHSLINHVDIMNTHRGLPVLSLVLHEIEKMTDADLFELDSMAMNSSIAGFITNNLNYDVGSAFPTDAENLVSQNTTSAGVPIDHYKTTYKEIKQGGMMLQNLPPGTNIQPYDTKRPNANMTNYMNSKMEYLGVASAGIPLEVIKQTFSDNFSASRAATDLAWKVFTYYNKNNFITHNQLDYEIFLNYYIASGDLKVSEWDIIHKRKAWCNAVWHGQSKPTFNPLQEAKASQVLLEEGLTSREIESQKFSDTSATENVRRLVNENIQLAEANKVLAELVNKTKNEEVEIEDSSKKNKE